MVVSCQVGSRNWTQGLLKGNLWYCWTIFSAHLLNQSANSCNIYYLFYGRVLTVEHWLSWNSIYEPGWPWTHKDPPDSGFQALGLNAWVPVSLTTLLLLCVGLCEWGQAGAKKYLKWSGQLGVGSSVSTGVQIQVIRFMIIDFTHWNISLPGISFFFLCPRPCIHQVSTL